jgi:hypothetical protein
MALSGKRQLQGVAGLEQVFIQEALTAAQRAQHRKWLLSATYQAARAAQRPIAWRQGVTYY